MDSVTLMVRLCSPFSFVQGDPESIEGSPSLSEIEGSEALHQRDTGRSEGSFEILRYAQNDKRQIGIVSS